MLFKYNTLKRCLRLIVGAPRYVRNRVTPRHQDAYHGGICASLGVHYIRWPAVVRPRFTGLLRFTRDSQEVVLCLVSLCCRRSPDLRRASRDDGNDAGNA
ncbi:unnamed protein product [Euphydryas editha]|uniref:Uncharacterized protein n=1 Tax=Euphydryas editha TaxID=104508 RepID=A0AAU9UKM7_EUPED|nr:unnamed protein product [Euphydryas editha]